MSRIDNIINQHERELRAEDLAKEENGKLVINHVNTADAMIKMISLAPIHHTIKKIMIMRIGSAFKASSHKPMSHMQIALQLGMKEEEVFKLEAEGIAIVSDYMERVCVHDATEAFKKERSIENEVRSTLEDSKPKGQDNDTT